MKEKTDNNKKENELPKLFIRRKKWTLWPSITGRGKRVIANR